MVYLAGKMEQPLHHAYKLDIQPSVYYKLFTFLMLQM